LLHSKNSPKCIFLWENFARVGDIGAKSDLRGKKHLHHCKIPDLKSQNFDEYFQRSSELSFAFTSGSSNTAQFDQSRGHSRVLKVVACTKIAIRRPTPIGTVTSADLLCHRLPPH
jgi:hypothetical protein